MSVAATLVVPLRPLRCARVAVVGAGAAGLAAARELRAEGHDVAVLEASDHVGGTWRYSAARGVHSSMYSALRTNLPRELMAFSSLSFDTSFTGDARRFCGHREVAAYLEAFAEVHALWPLVSFRTRVLRAEPVRGDVDGSSSTLWRVTTVQPGMVEQTRLFDALVVANGHYSVPRWPPVPGLLEFAASRDGAVTHTHDYRTPGCFADLRVLVLGAAASGCDVSRDIAPSASAVLLSSAAFVTDTEAAVQTRPLLSRMHPDGRAQFADGRVDQVDAVLLATGYLFSFPFLEGTDCVRVDDNAVTPLFEHLFPPTHAPSLSFIGLPWRVVPFPLFELQARWVARLLSGAAPLPPLTDMERAAAQAEARLQPQGPVPRRHAHALTADEQFDLADRMADAGGVPRLPAWRKRMYEANSCNKRQRPDDYRDVWDPADACRE